MIRLPLFLNIVEDLIPPSKFRRRFTNSILPPRSFSPADPCIRSSLLLTQGILEFIRIKLDPSIVHGRFPGFRVYINV